MGVIVFHDHTLSRSLMPLTAFRPVADLTVGIGSIAENWQQSLEVEAVAYATQPRLVPLFPSVETLQGDVWHILGGLLPTDELVALVRALPVGTCVCSKGRMLAAHLRSVNVMWEQIAHDQTLKAYEVEEVHVIERPWHLFQYSAEAILFAERHIRTLRRSMPLDSTVQVLGTHDIFLEEGATVHFCSLHAPDGPR